MLSLIHLYSHPKIDKPEAETPTRLLQHDFLTLFQPAEHFRFRAIRDSDVHRNFILAFLPFGSGISTDAFLSLS